MAAVRLGLLRPLHACTYPGCSELVRDGGRCAKHRRPWPVHAPGYMSSRWWKYRAAQLRRQPACEVCGEPATEVDHIVPRRLGGSDDPPNLQSLCTRCHRAKTGQEARAARAGRLEGGTGPQAGGGGAFQYGGGFKS